MHRRFKIGLFSLLQSTLQLGLFAQGSQPSTPILGLKQFKFETWDMWLPKDWSDRSEKDNGVYLESGDQSKGIYFMALYHKGPDKPNPEKTLQTLIQGGQKGLDAMKGYDWKRPSKAKRIVHGGVIQYSDEFYESAKMYFISTVIFVAPNDTVRITFHDYNCTNLDASRAFFSPVIQSLRINGITP